MINIASEAVPLVKNNQKETLITEAAIFRNTESVSLNLPEAYRWPKNLVIREFFMFCSDPNGFQIGFSLCFGMAFLASSFIVFLVQERSSKAKHIQFVSGVDPISYWTSAYLWDIINFVLPSIVIVILFLIFRVEAFEGKCT